MLVSKARSPPKSGLPEKALHSDTLWSYSQKLEKAGKVCQGQTLLLFKNIHKLLVNSFITSGSDIIMGQCYKIYK
jgi:hypothetical protein